MTYIITILVLLIVFLAIFVYKMYSKNQKLKDELKKFNNIDLNYKKSFLDKITQPIIDIYEKYNFILFLVASIILYVLASINFGDLKLFNDFVIEAHTISNILTSFATVVLSSGVFSSITKSNHFLNIFSGEIKKIIYTEKFLSKQKNIDEIWNIVTKSVCDENFHKISDKLFEKIKSNYLPINHNFYYENFNIELQISFPEDSGTDYVTIKEVTKVDLICEDTNAIDYCFSSNIDYPETEEDKTSYNILQFKVNDVDKMLILEKDILKENGILRAKVNCKLDSCLKYSIHKVEEKKYSLKLNSNRVHSARKIYNNFKLAVYYPDSLRVRFAKLGLDDKWSEVEICNIGNDMKYLKTEYNGIFFQNQGYMLNFAVD